tara:strand:- start:36002 stop:36619 length:618 start_codon:yes stop_codon:yes gene_type:complete
VFLLSNIKSNSRKLKYIEARSVIYVLLRDHLYFTFARIGQIFGKNHATVLHAYNQYPYLEKHNPSLKNKYEVIQKLWLGFSHKSSKSIPENYQKQIKSLREQNNLLKLSHNILLKKIKLMVWANEDVHECKYTVDDVSKILKYKTWTDKQKIDTLLHIDCAMYSNLGLDSTMADRKDVKQKSKIIYRTIKTLDEGAGNLFLQSMD